MYTWRQELTPQLDKLADKGIKERQTKLCQTFFFELIDILDLIDVWRCKSGLAKGHNFFPQRDINLFLELI